MERALVPLARDAAIGSLAADLAHDAGNALFGLTGLLDLLEAGDLLGAERIALLQRSAGDLDRVIRPLLELVRAARDDRVSADLAAAVGIAAAIFHHGERPPVHVTGHGSSRVACPPALVVQAVLHLLLATRQDTAIAVDLEDGAVRVGPVGSDESLDEVVARRIALDNGGVLERDADAFRLRLPSA